MSEHELSCVVIQQNTKQQHKLLQLVRASYPKVKIGLATSPAALKSLLTIRSTALLFYVAPADKVSARRYERKLLILLQRFAPDCILVRMTQRAWMGFVEVKTVNNGGQNSEVCAIATVNSTLLRLQLDYLIAYARLKTQFRQCKHLLSIAGLRSQWLVEYAREAVAYIAGDRHLYVNVAYLSLFGLGTVSDAQALNVLELIQPEDQAVFNAVKRTAEQQAKPSNKLLLTLQTMEGKRFRAEIRCVPAVYQGRRCVQLHVHPLLSGEKQPAEMRLDHDEKATANPWEQQSESAREMARKTSNSGHKNSSSVPTMLAGEAIKQLQPAFKELLNLKGKDYPALLRAQPWLSYGNARLDYTQLLANAHDQSTRFQLDYWNLQAALNFLIEQHGSPLEQKVVVSLGNWALTNVQQVAQLLKLLKKRSAVNKQLILGLDSSICLRRRKTTNFLLPLYKASGANLMFEQVQAGGVNLFTLLELSGSSLVQLHTSYVSDIDVNTGVSETLQSLLQQMSEREVATVVSGVQDLNMLNLLSETSATYLQGPILDKFNR